jgi:hypothetical protein
VEDIFVPEQYMDLSEIYLSDIAIIVAKKLFKFSLTVQPVCVDWTKTSDGFLNSVKKLFELREKGIWISPIGCWRLCKFVFLSYIAKLVAHPKFV